MAQSYLAFSIVSFFFNPIMGIIAIACSARSRSIGSDAVKRARTYSDTAFGFAFVGILMSILVVVEVYAFGLFPEYTYFVREKVICEASGMQWVPVGDGPEMHCILASTEQ